MFIFNTIITIAIIEIIAIYIVLLYVNYKPKLTGYIISISLFNIAYCIIIITYYFNNHSVDDILNQMSLLIITLNTLVPFILIGEQLGIYSLQNVEIHNDEIV